MDHVNYHQQLMNSTMRSGDFSDLLLICKGRKFPVHKMMVCTQSDFFKKACQGEFKESKTSEINLEDDLESVERMIKYMYTCTYDEKAQSPGGEEHGTDNDTSENTEDHKAITRGGPTQEEQAISSSSVRTYAIADKYGVHSLKSLAQDKFKKWLEVNWSSDHCPAITIEAFQTTPTGDAGLRDIVASTVAQHVPEIIHSPAWQGILAEYGQLTLQVLTQSTLSHLGAENKLNMDILQLNNEVKKLNMHVTQRDDEVKHLTADVVQRDKEIKKLTQGKLTVQQNLRSLRDQLQNNATCRHCHVPFWPYADPQDPSTLKCKVCQTRNQ